MFRSEQEFSKALVETLRANYWFVQRLESATTGVGIPDLWVAKNGKDFFIELKNMPKCDGGLCIPVPWRRGQQAWALEYLRHMERPMYTICALKHAYAIVVMNQHYAANNVSRYFGMTSIHGIVSWLNDDCRTKDGAG